MKIKTINVGFRPLTDAQKGRSPGLHLSDVIREIMIRRDPDKFDPNRPPDEGKMELGCAWEAYDRAKRQQPISFGKEYSKDGIICSPDGVANTEVLEWKLTWSSPDRDPVDFHWYWLYQIKGYCHVVGVKQATLVVAYVNGRYKPMEPVCLEHRFTFTKRDLIENWTEILAVAKEIRRESIASAAVRHGGRISRARSTVATASSSSKPPST